MTPIDHPDVIVIGSGAGGGMIAHELSISGLNVVMLEAGRDYDPVTETPMFHSMEEAPLRGAQTPDKENGYFDATVDGGWTVPGEPYSVATNSDPVRWWRPRMVGGRTNHWGRITLRFGPYDFKPYDRDGLGFNWPITYDDLEEWYDKVEMLIGITGAQHGYENSPDPPAEAQLPPPPLRVHEVFLKRAFEKNGMNVAAIRAAILTRPHNGRAACLYSTACTRGCSIGANFQTSTVLIPPAAATGNLALLTNAVVHSIEVNEEGKATGVRFFDRITGKESQISARVIVVAAGTAASARILLNSKSVIHPNGIGNSTGFVGKYLMDTVMFISRSIVPALAKIPAQNDDGIYAPHIYVPWWLHQEQKAGKLDFPRGYHIEPRGGRFMPTMDVGGYVPLESPAFGEELHEIVRSSHGTYIQLMGMGEMIPNEDSFCELDPIAKDKWGVPTLKFHWKWSEHEHKQVEHMNLTFNQIYGLLGGPINRADPKISNAGEAHHMVGGARMGSTPNDSVVDSFGQCWDVPNVFVSDGSTFVSSPDKNPTLTILALAARSSDRIVKLLKSGDL